jgi:hypothetical protein
VSRYRVMLSAFFLPQLQLRRSFSWAT